MDVDEGVISPGGVGYDINCGVRLVRTNLTKSDIKDSLRRLVDMLFQNIPCGVGSTSKLKLSKKEEYAVLKDGPIWAVKQGFGWQEDVQLTEQEGRIEGADPSALSERALERGRPQLGTLGSGNHFLEIQEVMDIFDPDVAEVFGLKKGQITVMIHTGSRGLGYQVCDDNLDRMVRAMGRYHISIPDKQLACAPVKSPEGKQYFAAMAAAANYAWANRQLILHWVRESFEKVLGQPAERLGMHTVYDVAHNIAKFEKHMVKGRMRDVVVHRKGATRAFPPGHSEIPEKYREVGQPVIIPGSMGTASYLLAGAQTGQEAFFSTCHGAGRTMSRHEAMRRVSGQEVIKSLESKGIVVKSWSLQGIAEEAPLAYKDVNLVVEVVSKAGLSKKVAKVVPLAVIKGE